MKSADYKIIKRFTDQHKVDREMVYQGIYLHYRHSENGVDLENLGVSKKAFVSVVDLPIIEIFSDINKIDELIQEDHNTKQLLNEEWDKENSLYDTIYDNNKVEGFFILKKGMTYYFCKRHKITFSPFTTKIEMVNFVKYYRENKLKKVFDLNQLLAEN